MFRKKRMLIFTQTQLYNCLETLQNTSFWKSSGQIPVCVCNHLLSLTLNSWIHVVINVRYVHTHFSFMLNNTSYEAALKVYAVPIWNKLFDTCQCEMRTEEHSKVNLCTGKSKPQRLFNSRVYSHVSCSCLSKSRDVPGHHSLWMVCTFKVGI